MSGSPRGGSSRAAGKPPATCSNAATTGSASCAGPPRRGRRPSAWPANPAGEVGRAGARRLLDRLEGRVAEPSSELIIPARLMRRESA
ncbi:hypothetical protein [Nonomuraea rosea]|uniref:hypothetical protein n=1 Tax=Nonomuraea rosea TaxID=638574 RepID=UPI0031E6B0D8